MILCCTIWIRTEYEMVVAVETGDLLHLPPIWGTAGFACMVDMNEMDLLTKGLLGGAPGLIVVAPLAECGRRWRAVSRTCAGRASSVLSTLPNGPSSPVAAAAVLVLVLMSLSLWLSLSRTTRTEVIPAPGGLSWASVSVKVIRAVLQKQIDKLDSL